MANPDLLGEFNKFYYDIGDYDLETKTDEAILIDASWQELCITDLSLTRSFTEHTFNDRCSPEEEEVAPGRRQTTFTFNLNQLRWKTMDPANYETMLKEWYDAVDGRSIIAILALTDDRSLDNLVSVPTTFGFVGNMNVSQADESQPQEGPNVEAYTMRPAAGTSFTPTIKRVYGSDF